MPRAQHRYGLVSIALHWSTAVLVIAMYPLAWWMTRAINEPETQANAFEAYQVHKSVGLTILVLSVIRVVWRLLHRAPPLPEEMPRWERWGARLTHVLLYVLIVGLPLSGWMYVSAGWNRAMGAAFAIPTLWFNQFEWPHIGFVASLSEARRAVVADVSMNAHELLGWSGILLVAVHVAAALKHHLVDRDDVLAGMAPWVRPRHIPQARKETGNDSFRLKSRVTSQRKSTRNLHVPHP